MGERDKEVDENGKSRRENEGENRETTKKVRKREVQTMSYEEGDRKNKTYRARA